jgi:hypothetical protein
MKSKPVTWETGSVHWYAGNIRHREDGPAVEWSSGSKEWWVNGKLHRIDGPAVEYATGEKYWYLNGERFSFEEFLKKIPEEYAVLLALEWK